MKRMGVSIILALALIWSSGCGGSGSSSNADLSDGLAGDLLDSFDPNTPIELDEGIEGKQVDRAGRARILELLFFDDQTLAAEFKTLSPDSDNTNPTASHARTNLQKYFALNPDSGTVNLSGFDPQFGDLQLDSQKMFVMLLLEGNFLKVNLDGTNLAADGTQLVPVTDGYLGLETEFQWSVRTKPAFGGRIPRTDVIDVMLTILTGGELTTDGVDGNDVAFKLTFPYLPDSQ